jgi:hypothetical protein
MFFSFADLSQHENQRSKHKIYHTDFPYTHLLMFKPLALALAPTPALVLVPVLALGLAVVRAMLNSWLRQISENRF